MVWSGGIPDSFWAVSERLKQTGYDGVEDCTAAEVRELRNRYASLTPREGEVMAHIVAGRLNKQVGWDLGISEITVKAHRGRMMRKMKARSLAELVRMAARLCPSPALKF